MSKITPQKREEIVLKYLKRHGGEVATADCLTHFEFEYGCKTNGYSKNKVKTYFAHTLYGLAHEERKGGPVIEYTNKVITHIDLIRDQNHKLESTMVTCDGCGCTYQGRVYPKCPVCGVAP